jgi:UTP--glucose-1-phosphate uridylyltransferase
MKIRKAVIPAAGLGTRFLPATKTIPKEMLPIVDKPTILYNVEEIIAADIPELILIAGREKTAIEDFFDTSYELDDTLEKLGKRELLNPIRSLRQRIRVISVRQQKAMGLGHAILCAEPVVGKEPFAVLLGDEIMISLPGQRSAIGQLAERFEKTGTSVVAVMEVPADEVHKYGIVRVQAQEPGVWQVQGVVEKPSLPEAPSRLALPGRYVFDAEIFNCLREVKPGRLGEIQLSDGMQLLAQRHGLLAMTVQAQRFDAGDKFGFLQANIEMALRHPEIGADFTRYLEQRIGEL